VPICRVHKRIWEIAFGSSVFPVVPVDKQMDEYSQKTPGLRHRLKDHDPLRTGDYEDPWPDLDKWRIVYRLFHIAADCWQTNLSKVEKKDWEQKIKSGIYPSAIDGYFWQTIECIKNNPLDIYKLLPWPCEPLPESWIEYIEKKKGVTPNFISV
jgi:hypothetical protein